MLGLLPGALSGRAPGTPAQRNHSFALDMVEVNPILDERNRTAELAVDLVLSAVGKRVWNAEDVPSLEG